MSHCSCITSPLLITVFWITKLDLQFTNHKKLYNKYWYVSPYQVKLESFQKSPDVVQWDPMVGLL